MGDVDSEWVDNTYTDRQWHIRPAGLINKLSALLLPQDLRFLESRSSSSPDVTSCGYTVNYTTILLFLHQPLLVS